MLHHAYSVLGTDTKFKPGMKGNILNQVKDLDFTSWDFKSDGNIIHYAFFIYL